MKTMKVLLPLLLIWMASGNLSAQCTASFWVSNSGLGDYSFWPQFSDSSMQASQVYWDFGDGDTAHSYQATHHYQASGAYVVCMYYQGIACSGSYCDTIAVDVCSMNGLSIHYINNGPIVEYYISGVAYWPNLNHAWTFPGGSISSSTQENPQLVYAQSGDYEVCVTVDNGGNCSNSVCDTVTLDISNYVPCNAKFTWQQNLYSLDVLFTQLDSSGFMENYTWYFGDDSVGHEAPALYHTYDTIGAFNVCLVSQDISGCYDSICNTVIVNLPQPVPVYQWLAGRVYTGATAACNAEVYLIKEDTSGHLALIGTYNVTEDTVQYCGQYGFYVQEGEYYVKAALTDSSADYANYLPTYYGDELNWANATLINLNATITNADINLIAGTNPGGPGFVGGWVSQGAGLSIAQNNNDRAAGDPLPGVQINLLTDADMPVAYTYSDANGHFTFGNLALGSYKVYAEALNKTPVPLNLTLTQNNPTVDDVLVEINSDSAVSTGIADWDALYVEGITPNPTKDQTTIVVSVKQAAEAELLLSDVSGRIIQQRKLQLNEGRNTLVIKLNDEAAGIYYLHLQGRSANRTLKLVKTQ